MQLEHGLIPSYMTTVKIYKRNILFIKLGLILTFLTRYLIEWAGVSNIIKTTKRYKTRF